MDWLQSVPGWLAIPIAIYGVYLQRRQNQMLAAQEMPRAARRRGDVPNVRWWKSPAIAVLAALVVLAWAPWVLSQFEDKPLINKNYGMYSNELDQNKRYTKLVLFISIDGKEISRYETAYKLVAVAAHRYGTIDIEDVSDLQKSTSYYIKPEQLTLLINVDQKFLDEFNRGDRMTIYFLVLVPESISTTPFATLHQAKAIGAKILPIGVGPP